MSLCTGIYKMKLIEQLQVIAQKQKVINLLMLYQVKWKAVNKNDNLENNFTHSQSQNNNLGKY